MTCKQKIICMLIVMMVLIASSCSHISCGRMFCSHNPSFKHFHSNNKYHDLAGVYFDTHSPRCRNADKSRPLIWLILNPDTTCTYTEAIGNATITGSGKWFFTPNVDTTLIHGITIILQPSKKDIKQDSTNDSIYINYLMKGFEILGKNRLKTHTHIFKKVSDKEAKKRIECK